jgi:hypothetical protein
LATACALSTFDSTKNHFSNPLKQKKMKNLIFILLSVLLNAACNSSSDELASPASSPIGSRSQQARAFHATLSAALNPNSAPTACSGALPLALLDYTISGNATHLGILNSTLSFLHHIDCDLNLETATLSTNVNGQLVGANGDLIYYSGQDVINVYNFLTGSGPNGPITGTWTITGGTGKFVGATGSVTLSGLVDFTTLSFTAAADGTITY